ncbi:MAG TPA: preprotein translocase subunit YajC [Syntrophomonadaceae bacterium]|nr:preprotein translocase subunit YajC [Syntrophomonadaceae bacterium]HNX28591.1 preprotein translocase subunit YajC [Syntrophomonadaceae bacterium]HPR93989.1 preprotein translocase subunit YajC [Syntrophomonadaceae bacterium]
MDNQWVVMILYFGVFIGIFYVFIIMPRKKQEKKHDNFINEMKRGMKVTTIGGIRGEVARIKDDTIVLKVADNTEIEFIKKAIAYEVNEEK